MTAAKKTVRNTPNQLTGVKLSHALLSMPVFADAITACIVSGNAVDEALKVSRMEAIAAADEVFAGGHARAVSRSLGVQASGGRVSESFCCPGGDPLKSQWPNASCPSSSQLACRPRCTSGARSCWQKAVQRKRLQ